MNKSRRETDAISETESKKVSVSATLGARGMYDVYAWTTSPELTAAERHYFSVL